VFRDDFAAVGEAMAVINTTHGPVDDRTLARTVGFEDRPDEFVVWVEWRLGEDVSAVPAHVESGAPANPRELVRRDAHVILKAPSVIADALVGGL
jgi:hypothetical protein